MLRNAALLGRLSKSTLDADKANLVKSRRDNQRVITGWVRFHSGQSSGSNIVSNLHQHYEEMIKTHEEIKRGVLERYRLLGGRKTDIGDRSC